MTLIKSFFSKWVFLAIIIMASIYQLAMVGFYLWGFSGIDENINQLQVEIVNQDQGQLGNKITSNLEHGLDYRVTKTNSLIKSKDALRQSKIDLIINIPHEFTRNIINGKPVAFNFYQNRAVPATIAGNVRGISTVVTPKIEERLQSQKNQVIFGKILIPMVTEKVTKAAKLRVQNEVKKEMALKIKENPEIMTNSVIENRIKSEVTKGIEVTVNKQVKKDIKQQIHKKIKMITSAANVRLSGKINNVDHGKNKMLWQMVPMFLTMATYLGAMIGTVTLVGMINGFRTRFNKWKVLGTAELGGIVLSIISPCFGVGLVMMMLNLKFNLAMALYFQTVIIQVVSLNFALVVGLLFRSFNLWVNIPIMMLSVVVGGGTIPLSMLPNEISWFHWITPLYPAVQATFSILFKTNEISQYEFQLGLIGMVSLLLVLAIVAVQTKPTPKII